MSPLKYNQSSLQLAQLILRIKLPESVSNPNVNRVDFFRMACIYVLYYSYQQFR